MHTSKTKPLDINSHGKTTMVVSYGPASPEYPRGGTLNRLENILILPRETWDSAIQRMLDERDAAVSEEKRTYFKKV
jgi:hypothetical protein